LNYTDYIAIMCKLLTYNLNDDGFLAWLPRMIDYAEQRIYREGDFLTTVVSDSTVATTANTRIVNLPTDQYLFVVQDVNIITPFGTTNPELGTRNPLTKTTKEWLNQAWPSATGATVPKYVATQSDQTFLLGPWPDQAYTVEFVGTIRPAPLSPTNTTTFLTLHLPDLFIAASMIFGTGLQRDFGAQSEDPQAGQSWQSQYDKLIASTSMEEMRKKWMSGQSSAPATAGSTPS
jgi:hypothetical protein